MERHLLLVVDIGNSQTVFGVYDLEAPSTEADSGLLQHWQIETKRGRTADELAATVGGFFRIADLHFADIDGVCICSVVPPVLSTVRHLVERYLDVDPVVIGPGVKSGVPILYDNPREVGADRIANAVAAYDLYGGPVIVVDFGTGTNYDIVSAAGGFLGGAITPGVEISMEALRTHASALGAVELVEPRNVIGRSTAEALQSGAVYGFAGSVDGLVARFQADPELDGEARVVATGRHAELIAPVASTVELVEPYLTVHGLRLVYGRNT